jgi:hypothetical protein
LLDISDITLGNGFKEGEGSEVNIYNGVDNFLYTFYLSSDPGTTGAQPKFADGTCISQGTLTNLTSSHETFANRTGMNGYDSLNAMWK